MFEAGLDGAHYALEVPGEEGEAGGVEEEPALGGGGATGGGACGGAAVGELLVLP